jgi:hypothetical protein
MKQETNKPDGNNMMMLTLHERDRSLEEHGKTKDEGIRWQNQIRAIISNSS